MASSESDKLDEITNALNEVNDILVEFNKKYDEIKNHCIEDVEITKALYLRLKACGLLDTWNYYGRH